MVKINRKYIIAGLSCGFLLVSGICYFVSYHKNTPSAVLVSSEQQADKEMINEIPNSEVTTTSEVNAEIKPLEITTTPGATLPNNVSDEAEIYVHICGAVTTPGVYQVAVDARIIDLIELSGGLKEEAAGDYINQAQKVTDGQRVYIPTREEVAGLSAVEFAKGSQSSSEGNQSISKDTSEEGTEQSSIININTAEEEELMNLPGIGQAKADSIIKYRTENGKFKTKEDLMNIPGIKEGVFNRISAYIIVE